MKKKNKFIKEIKEEIEIDFIWFLYGMQGQAPFILNK